MTDRIPAITVWQPWATLIQIGAKPYEFRRWPAPQSVRGRRVAIHAAARPVRPDEVADLILRLRREGGKGTGLIVPEALELLERVHTSPGILPLSSILCTAILGTPRRAAELFRAQVEDSDRVDQHIWAWPLSDIEPVQPVAPARGQQGWWWWQPDEALAA